MTTTTKTKPVAQRKLAFARKIMPPVSLDVIQKAKASAENPPVLAEVMLITPVIARQMRDNLHFPRQRAINPVNVARLARAMRAGTFNEGTPISIASVAPPKSQMYIVNGNHTLEAIVVSGIPQVMTLIYVDVANEDEAGAIYSRHDIQRTRTWTDTYKATGNDDLMPTSHGTQKLGQATQFILSGFQEVNRGAVEFRENRIEMMREWAVEARAYNDILTQSPARIQKMMWRAAVMAVGLVLLRHSPERADEFLRGVTMDDGLRDGDPRKTLLNWLRDNNSSEVANKRILPCKAVAACWNAFYRGQSRQYVKPTTMHQFNLADTPYQVSVDEATDEN